MAHRAGFLAVATGLTVGLVLGLIYAWLIAPVELYNTTPALLRSDYRHEWIRLAALGYVADGNLQRALSRLDGLEQEDVQTALAALIESYAAQGQPAEMLRTLSWLAEQRGVHTPVTVSYTHLTLPTIYAV